MDKDSIIKYDIEKGFGEVLWIACPSCYNTIKLTQWEDGTREEVCVCCERKALN